MLEQYRATLAEGQQASEGKEVQLSKRKLVFILAGAALALLCFLFLLGSFRDTGSRAVLQDASLQQVFLSLKQVEKSQEKLSERVAVIESMAEQQLLSSEKILSNTEPDPALEALVAKQELRSSVSFFVAPTPRTYVVLQGDTLSDISMKQYSTSNKWQKIYEANKTRIDNINNLKVGTELIIPD